MTLYQITGFVLIALPVVFNVVFFMLARSFSYPDILRQPTETILRRFAAGGPRLVALWYAFAMTALLAIPTAFLVQAVFADQPLAVPSAVMGTLSGLVQTMGLLRWPLLVPSLAAQYTAADATPAHRDAIGVVFQAFHQYVGVVVGEHLGYIFTAAWTLLICLMLLSSPLFSPLVALLGIVAAVGILVGLLEPAGWSPAGAINAISYLVWSAWMIMVGVGLLVG